MRTLARIGIAAGCLAAAFAIGGAALEAKNPDAGVSGAVGGRYAMPDGYVRLAVDDGGRVEGYYERNGVFGQIDGVMQGARFEGYWASAEGDEACPAPRRDNANWGRISLEFLSSDEFVGIAGACGASPTGDDRWTGRRP